MKRILSAAAVLAALSLPIAASANTIGTTATTSVTMTSGQLHTDSHTNELHVGTESSFAFSDQYVNTHNKSVDNTFGDAPKLLAIKYDQEQNPGKPAGNGGNGDGSLCLLLCAGGNGGNGGNASNGQPDVNASLTIYGKQPLLSSKTSDTTIAQHDYSTSSTLGSYSIQTVSNSAFNGFQKNTTTATSSGAFVNIGG